LPPPDAGDEPPEEPEPLHSVAEGVTVFVIVPPPEYESEMDEAEPLHVLLVTSLVTSDESSCKVGEEIVIEEPDASVTEKLPELTVMDCIAALEPETSSV
jgi:hypothetical protein